MKVRIKNWENIISITEPYGANARDYKKEETSYLFIPEMRIYCGKIVTIIREFDVQGRKAFRIREDNERFIWQEWMFKPLKRRMGLE